MFVADHSLLIIFVALVIDAIAGDPVWLYKRIPHPVAIIGNAIAAIDARINRDSSALRSFLAGSLSTVVLVAFAIVVGVLVHWLLAGIDYGWIVEAIVVSTLLAFRGLYDAIKAVARGLEAGIQSGRDAVAHVVGRDPSSLDAAGVARAAIESAAENFADGVVAPVFWYVLFGLPGILAYKTINTLDSMLGHRDARYEYFGKAAARVDDAVNWLPARLSALLLVAGASITAGASAAGAWRSAWRDAGLHRSVNAGWPEAAMAGALDFALAGPRRYQGETVDDAWMGNGRAELSAADVHASLRVYVSAAALLALLLVAALLLSRS